MKSFKILYIIPNLRKGGAERMVIDLVREFSGREGIDVRLVVFQNDIEYHIDDIKHLVFHVPAHIEISPIRKNHCYVDELQDFVDKFNPNIIHSQLFSAEIISRSINFPQAKWFSLCQDNMYQFRNFSFKTLLNKKSLTSFYEKKYLFKQYKRNGGNYFICISKHTQQYYQATAGEYPNTLLYNAINYSRFYKPKVFANKSKLQLINTGTFVDKKNQAFLIDVAQILSNKNIDFELHLLGDGIKKDSVKAKVDQLSLNDKVIFHGKVHDVETYLWHSDIYLHSATYEPFGLVLIEAMAAGLPVITLDGQGNRDLIEQGKNGFMFFDQNAEEFANKIIALWSDKKEYERMSLYAQEYSKQYDIKAYVDNLLKIYKEHYS